MTEMTRWHRDPWSVFDELEALERNLNQGLIGLDEQRRTRRRDGFPPMNVWVSAEGLVADVELPGVDPKEVDVSVTGDEMTVSGRVAGEEDPKDMVVRRRERDACGRQCRGRQGNLQERDSADSGSAVRRGQTKEDCR